MQKRNAACQEFASTKTAGSKLQLQQARKELKKEKIRAKNMWLLDMANEGNQSLLPAPGGRKTQTCIFRMARKLVNGMDKYRSWQGGNVRDEAGNVAGTAEGNADNFQAFYNDLLHNTGDTTQGYEEYAKMDTRSVDCWTMGRRVG